MGKVVLKSVQDRKSLKSILMGEYKPDFKLGYGSFDQYCSKSYKYMLDELAKKTGKCYKFGEETCIWSWFQNPFYRNHLNYKNIGVDLVVITFEVDESEVVFSDFDIWCERIVDAWNLDVVLDLKDIDKDACIQAVTWNIPPEGILKVESFSKYIDKSVVA